MGLTIKSPVNPDRIATSIKTDKRYQQVIEIKTDWNENCLTIYAQLCHPLTKFVQVVATHIDVREFVTIICRDRLRPPLISVSKYYPYSRPDLLIATAAAAVAATCDVSPV